MSFDGAFDLSTLKSSAFDKNEPMIRILVCRNCKTIEELPDWDGDPRNDTLLNVLVSRHQQPEEHIGLLMKFPVKYWAVPKIQAEIVKQIRGGSEGLDAIQANFYATKNQFAEDAMTCFAEHLRPKGQCSDYKSEKKMLKPETNKERQEANLDKYERTGGPKVYLCDFCPVKSYNMKKSNLEKGLYN
jgi:hypothetical protein